MQEKCENEKINRVWRKQELPVIGQEQTQNGVRQQQQQRQQRQQLFAGFTGFADKARLPCLAPPCLACLPVHTMPTDCRLACSLPLLFGEGEPY